MCKTYQDFSIFSPIINDLRVLTVICARAVHGARLHMRARYLGPCDRAPGARLRARFAAERLVPCQYHVLIPCILVISGNLTCDIRLTCQIQLGSGMLSCRALVPLGCELGFCNVLPGCRHARDVGLVSG